MHLVEGEKFMSFTQQSLAVAKFTFLLAVSLFACEVFANAASQENESQNLSKLYQQVATNLIRTDEDRQVDVARKPIEFLQFTNVRPGMMVLDVATGRGYSTQLLALAVGSSGTVWAQADKLRSEITKRLADHPQSNIRTVVRPYDDPIPADVPKLDLITIVLNYHDIAYMPVDRAQMNQRLFNGLKSGGHLIVIDHSAKKGEGTSVAKSLHRIEKEVVLSELRQAGFQLEQEGDFLHNPTDPREQPFFNMNMPTDSFALRFVKP
jgi:predicted methyltransferase